jgi:hypothetical protein
MEPYGLAAITGFERLAYLKTDTVAGGQSSYDRKGFNGDFIREPDFPNSLGQDSFGDEILLDLEGPGVVYRIWCTGFNFDKAAMHIHIDGALVVPPAFLQDLFVASNRPFLHPLAGTCPHSAPTDANDGGFYCYLPIPFQKSIRITATGLSRLDRLGFYYNIGYHTFAPGTAVQSWTGNENSDAAVALWRNVGQDPKPKPKARRLPAGHSSDRKWLRNSISILPGRSARLLNVPGPAAIAVIRIRVEGATPTGPFSANQSAADLPLNNLWLHIAWNNDPDPGVHAPLSMFFALGHFGYQTASRSLAVGLDGEWLYSYFPMPFQQRATIDLENHSLFALESLDYEIEYTAFSGDFSNVGYFKTAFAQQSLAANTPSISFLETEGAGHLVGVVESVEGPTNLAEMKPCLDKDGKPIPVCFLEGDERIYVDDCRTPIIQGTGTEDFYNSGWYFDKTPFSREMHGCTFYDEDLAGRGWVSAHRLFLQDAIPFRKNIRALIEHGPQNDVSVHVWTLAYYYHQPDARAALCDSLDLGDSVSVSSHNYSGMPMLTSALENQQVTWTSTFEGEQDTTPVTATGLIHRDFSEFVISVPPYNQGLILRRMFDQSVPGQRVVVQVDDQIVGTWFTVGINPFCRWREADFLIPATMTAGKSRTRLRLQSLEAGWTEFKYWVYSRSL